MKHPFILNISTLSNTDWKDNDVVMLHACFHLLGDCVDNEKLLTGDIDWENDEEHRSIKQEVEALYDWWKGRKKADEPVISVHDEKKLYDKDDGMLIRLIKIRRHLWT